MTALWRFNALFTRAFLTVATVSVMALAAASGSKADTGSQFTEIRIAAVVNDQVISVSDVDSRTKMVLLSSNIPDTPEIRKRIEPKVLRSLIDEKLQLQAAKRQHIAATDAELRKAIAQIEKQNHMQPGQLTAYLKAHGIDPSVLINQLTASIVWAKLVRQKAAETNPISDQEIDSTLNRLKAHQHEPESRVAEIFLPVDNPDQDAEERQLAERLGQQMHHGARFSAVAQQFSQSATAAVGGDLGWVRPDELNPKLAKAVEALQPGQLSQPIRTKDGYYLVLVIDRRGGNTQRENDTVLKIAQVVFPLPVDPTEAARRAAILAAEQMRKAATNCADFVRIGKQKAPKLTSEGTLRVSQIAPAMRKIVLSLALNQPSKPIVQRNGVGVLMVCGKTTPKATLPSRAQIGEFLTRQRLDSVARQYLRDLRRAAYVDVRVGLK